MNDENTMIEPTPTHCRADIEQPLTKQRPNIQRTIFRFKGTEDVGN